jgi:WD40 repeat protein
METQRTVIKAKTAQGRKNPITYCSYNRDGNIIGAGCEDGSIQWWPTKGPYNRPIECIREAHSAGGITSLCFHEDGYTLISRALDDTMKVWDIRNVKKPLAIFEDLQNFGDVNCITSPDGRLILTGTSVKKGAGTGLLVFFDKTLLSRVKQIGVAQGAGVISMLWHPKINQIIVGTSDAKVHVFYDPKLSTNGALLSVSR